MTRKDYVALANALGDALADAQDGNRGNCPVRDAQVRAVKNAALRVADALADDNSNFRRQQFIDAIQFRADTGKLVKVGQTRFDR